MESSGAFKIKEVLESLITHLQTRIATSCYNSKTVNVHIKEFSAISQVQEEYESFLVSIRIKRSIQVFDSVLEVPRRILKPLPSPIPLDILPSWSPSPIPDLFEVAPKFLTLLPYSPATPFTGRLQSCSLQEDDFLAPLSFCHPLHWANSLQDHNQDDCLHNQVNHSSVSIIGLALPNLLGFSLNLARKVKVSPLIEGFGLV